MVKVKIGDKIYPSAKGERLSDILIRNNLSVEHICGGKGSCGKCRVMVNGREELSCQYVVDNDVEVELFEAKDIASKTGVTAIGEMSENLCLALDIGTTTLALALVSLDDKKAIKVVTASNPQRAFGADIMNRIEYCRKHTVAPLQSVLIAEINGMIEKLGGATVETMFVAGNATMLHIFFGVDCSSIGVAPYTPVFLESKTVKAEELGIRGADKIISLPSISSFVGADIVAGMNYIGVPNSNKYNLLVDLGTNAEITLYSKEKGIATSAAAGPCFEGANISCGMSATSGAICSFEMDEDGKVSYKTIGDAEPVGICGTGLIDIVAGLLKNGIIDETGYMEDEEYVLAKDVALKEGDVRQYQLAKSAVCSAILTLLKTESVGFDDISATYISGGFSSEINITNAVASGLLPDALAQKAVPINNSSLLGIIKYACGERDLSRFTENIKYEDLSMNPYFADLFMENMMF